MEKKEQSMMSQEDLDKFRMEMITRHEFGLRFHALSEELLSKELKYSAELAKLKASHDNDGSLRKEVILISKEFNTIEEKFVTRENEHKAERDNLLSDLIQLKKEVAMIKNKDVPWLNSAVRRMQQIMDSVTHFMHSFESTKSNNPVPLNVAIPEVHQELDMTPMDALVSTHDSFIDFTQDTTIHGVRKVFNYDYSKGKRIRHALFFFLALTWCCTMSALAVRRYFSFPVISSMEVLYPQSIEFPAITICNKNRFKKSYYDAINQNGTFHLSYDDEYRTNNPVKYWNKMRLAFLKQQVKQGEIELNFTAEDNMTLLEVRSVMGKEQYARFNLKFHYAVLDFRTYYFKHIRKGGHQLDEITNIDTDSVDESHENHSSFLAFINVEPCIRMPCLCHTKHFLDKEKAPLYATNGRRQHQLLHLKFLEDEYINQDASPAYYIQIHPVGEMPEISKKYEPRSDQWLTLKPGRNMIYVRRQDVRNLPKPYGASDCTTGASLKHFQNYTKNGCQMECEAEAEIQKCRCNQAWSGAGELCPSWCMIFAGLHYNCSHCLPSCKSRKLTASIKHILLSNEDNSVRITQEMAMTVISQDVAYPGTSLLGEVGGLLGLCMGASLLTLVELVDLAISMVNGLGITLMAGRRQHRDAFNDRRMKKVTYRKDRSLNLRNRSGIGTRESEA